MSNTAKPGERGGFLAPDRGHLTVETERCAFLT